MPNTQNQSKMRFLRFFKPKQKKPFVSEVDFIMNRGRQSHKAIATLVELRELNVEEEDELKIDFFFHTDSMEKTEALIKEITLLNYNLNNKVNFSNKNLFVVAGQTTKIKMMHEIVRKWSFDMCELGYKHDCHFYNWEINI